MSTMDEFAPYKKKNGCFVVRNITPDRRKTIKIFNYPMDGRKYGWHLGINSH
jgi:hypothetical protein